MNSVSDDQILEAITDFRSKEVRVIHGGVHFRPLTGWKKVIKQVGEQKGWDLDLKRCKVIMKENNLMNAVPERKEKAKQLTNAEKKAKLEENGPRPMKKTKTAAPGVCVMEGGDEAPDLMAEFDAFLGDALEDTTTEARAGTGPGDEPASVECGRADLQGPHGTKRGRS